MLLNPISLLCAAVLAAVPPSPPSCIDLMIPVPINATSSQPLFPPFKSQFEATQFLLNATNRLSANSTTPLLKPAVNISLTFEIGATYCFPKDAAKKTSTVQLLTHGLGFDRSYWNLSAPAESYVASASASGYATLAYDRLGCGLSSRPDPYSIIQAPVELAVLATLTQLLRSGKLSPKIPVPGKVIHVGHSYGSQLSNALVSAQPKLSDGLVLTGYSLDATYQSWFLQSTGFHLAKDNIPAKFTNASTGFVTWGDKVANQFAFLTYPYFEPAVLDRAEAEKMPITIGELLTLKLISPLAPKFTGPVMIMAAEFDLIFCGGVCRGLVDGPANPAPKVFPAAKPLQIYVQPNTGHGMNLHKNATAWYGVVNDFLAANVS